MKRAKNPMQPVELVDGVVRFKENKVVRYMLDCGGTIDLNHITLKHAKGLFSNEDVEQFYQLIGYSVSGYGDVFPRRLSTALADAAVDEMMQARKRARRARRWAKK